MVHPKLWIFNFQFSSTIHFIEQPQIKTVQGFHPKTPTALSWFIQQTQTSSQSPQQQEMKLHPWRNTIYHVGSGAQVSNQMNASLFQSDQHAQGVARPHGTAHYLRTLSDLIMLVITIQRPSVIPAATDPRQMSLLTLIPCGSSPNEASSTLPTPDHFWGTKKVMLEVLSHKPCVGELCTGPFAQRRISGESILPETLQSDWLFASVLW